MKLYSYLTILFLCFTSPSLAIDEFKLYEEAKNARFVFWNAVNCALLYAPNDKNIEAVIIKNYLRHETIFRNQFDRSVDDVLMENFYWSGEVSSEKADLKLAHLSRELLQESNDKKEYCDSSFRTIGYDFFKTGKFEQSEKGAMLFESLFSSQYKAEKLLNECIRNDLISSISHRIASIKERIGGQDYMFIRQVGFTGFEYVNRKLGNELFLKKLDSLDSEAKSLVNEIKQQEEKGSDAEQLCFDELRKLGYY